MDQMFIILTKVEAECSKDCCPFWMNITCSLCEEIPLIKNISRYLSNYKNTWTFQPTVILSITLFLWLQNNCGVVTMCDMYGCIGWKRCANRGQKSYSVQVVYINCHIRENRADFAMIACKYVKYLFVKCV